MNRRSVQYHNKDIKIVQFNIFKGKNSQIVSYNSQNSFTLLKNTNLLSFGLLIRYPLKKRNQPIKQVSFSIMTFEQIPRSFISYQHEETLKSVLNLMTCKMVTNETIFNLINSYPIVEFVLNCYIRCVIFNQIQMIKSGESLKHDFTSQDLIGNQQELLSDYTTDIRGNLLNIAAKCFDFELKIIYLNNVIQLFGSNSVNNQGDQIKFRAQDIFMNNSTTNRSHTPRDYSRQSYLRNVRHSPAFKTAQQPRSRIESKSVTKQNLTNICHKCKKKTILCECNTNTAKQIKAIPQKMGLSSPNTIMNPLIIIKSNFVSQNKMPDIGAQNNDKKCKCNRSYSRYCKPKDI